MTPVRLIFFALTVCAASSFGGEIYGTIKEGGKPVAKGLQVTIELGEKSYAKPTDEYGGYRIVVTETGKCTAKIDLQGANPFPAKFNPIRRQSASTWS